MRHLQQDPTASNTTAQEGDSPARSGDDGAHDACETLEIYRVTCPDCRQPIALLADEDSLPEHALCPTPWNPFGLTVCQGSGRPVSGAPEADGAPDAEEQDAAVLLTLPESLDWRRQPFSHIGGPGARPIRVPRMRRSA
ncbi:hypothetical protein SSP35_14_00130 [Streptomyces sp. NBRC 110611]|nr:hypothetical protein SSP35_14_00130 [Streptomyces sp. NBRC 110611]